MKINVTTTNDIETIPVNINRSDGTTRATIQDGCADNCEHDNYTEEPGEPYVTCDTCYATGTVVDDISDDGWDGDERVFTSMKAIEWEVI